MLYSFIAAPGSDGPFVGSKDKFAIDTAGNLDEPHSPMALMIAAQSLNSRHPKTTHGLTHHYTTSRAAVTEQPR